MVSSSVLGIGLELVYDITRDGERIVRHKTHQLVIPTNYPLRPDSHKLPMGGTA